MSELDLGSVMGPRGITASVQIGSVTTLPSGSSATVTNSGNIHDAVLDFGIPKGDVGDGSGDMLRSVYDADGDGVVDDAAKLGGKLPGAYALVPATFTAGHIPVLTQDGGIADGGKSLDDIGNSSHTHSADDITSGILPIARGGTGATTAEDARAALGIGEITETVTIAHGGTSATTSADALINLGAAAKAHTHTATDITGGTLPVARGGTGATTISAVRNALGLGNTTGALSVANGGTGATTISAARNALGLGNTSGAVPIANGGTGATTAAAARANLGAAATNHTHSDMITITYGTSDIPANNIQSLASGTIYLMYE